MIFSAVLPGMIAVKTAAVIAIVIALIAALVVFLRLIFKVPLWILSSVSGWNAFSSRFPEFNADGDATKNRFCSVRMRGVDYRSCVNVFLSEEFETLQMGFPFRDYHPNICIPRRKLVSCSGSTKWLDEFKIQGDDTSVWIDNRIARQLRGG